MDRQTAKIFALSSRNVSKYEYLTGKDILLEGKLVRKSDYNKKIWRLSVRQGIKSRNWHCKESVSKLDNTFKFYEIIKKYKSATENYCKSSLIYNAKRSFYKYYPDIKKKLITFLSNKSIAF